MSPRRDPYAFAEVDPEYAEQIELRQEVGELGRAVQARPESTATRERLKVKYDEYLGQLEKQDKPLPSAEAQAHAVDPRGVEYYRELREEPPVVEPVVEPVVVDGVLMMPPKARPGNQIAGYIAFAALLSFGLSVAKNRRR